MKILDINITEDWVVEDADFAFDMIPIADRFSVQILERHRHEPMCIVMKKIKKNDICVVTMNSTLHRHTLTYEVYYTLYILTQIVESIVALIQYIIHWNITDVFTSCIIECTIFSSIL